MFLEEIQMEPIWVTLQRDESPQWGVFNFRNLEGEISGHSGSPLTFAPGRGSELLSSLPSQEPTVTGRKAQEIQECLTPPTLHRQKSLGAGSQVIPGAGKGYQEKMGQVEAWRRHRGKELRPEKREEKEGIIKNRSYLPKTLPQKPSAVRSLLPGNVSTQHLISSPKLSTALRMR